jgi:putative phosphoesterase
MNIAVLSDSHDQWKHIEWAINIANKEQCSYLLFAGDLMSTPMLSYFKNFNGKCIFVLGNNDGEIQSLTRKIDEDDNWFLSKREYDGEIEDRKIFMSHYPNISTMAAKLGDYNICIYGHSHIYHQEVIGDTLLLNPGEIMGRKNNPTMATVDLNTLSVTKHTYET